MTTAATRTVVLLGHPVSHSRSPQIHTAAFAATGFDAVYVTADVHPQRLDIALEGLQALGLLGANVTVPHKRRVAELIGSLTPEAELAGAVNTLFWSGDVLTGDNSDTTGLLRVLRDDIGVHPGDLVEIFGAGGAARATAVACGRLGLRVTVTARRLTAAAAVAALAARAGAVVSDERTRSRSPRVVVNATPLGMHGEALPEAYMDLRPDQVALDLVYGDEPTPFILSAQRNGARAYDGLGLLVAQAADSFERWTGQPAPVGVMADAAAG